jgi:hypothetical protein
MKYKILKKYRDERGMEAYELIPFESKETHGKIYKKNAFRQCMVGREFVDENNPDMFTYSNETDESIDLEVLRVFLDFSSNGYYQLEYTDKAGRKNKDFVHRVICYSFNSKYDTEKNEVHHVDKNKLNNRAENLMPTTPLFNSAAEFKTKNPKAREYMCKAINDEFRMTDYSDLVTASIEIVRDAEYYVFNEISKLNENEIKAMVYLLGKHGYDFNKKDNKENESK